MLARSRRKTWSAAVAMSLMTLAGAAQAQPTDPAAPTDPVEAAIESYTREMAAAREAGTRMTPEQRNELLARTFESIDPATLTAAQIQRIVQMGLLSPATGKEEAVRARLAELAEAEDESGALAACIQLQLATRIPPADETRTQAVGKALHDVLHHPGFEDAVRSGAAASLAGSLGAIRDKDAFAACADEVFAFAEGLDETASPKMLTGINTIVQGLRSAEADERRIEQVREHLVQVAAAAIDKAKEDPEFMTAQEVTRLQRQHDLLDGAWGRGQLIGYEAPSISFDWSTDEAVTSLEDLRGSVVVVDFWATWCGPCRGSFPMVAKLVDHYDGYPVRVIGVTSLQGYHISSDADNHERILCENDPAKEYGLMPEFMQEMGMNWDVMFSPTNVFNPQYGVNGIPHVAIIAPDGTVRHNALHPAAGDNPLAEKAKLIDAILAEFNLPHPEPVEDAAAAPAPEGGE